MIILLSVLSFSLGCGEEETCVDGILNQDEEEIDCGGVCSSCSEPKTCRDGILNQNEEEIDCGGVCAACPTDVETCRDGIRNQDEEGIDCGGVCAACQSSAETCADGIRNQDEEGVDCGGVCTACSAVETCTDGIRNQNETEVDCGGVCAACGGVVETCTDGLQNQNEQGVDCGGVCAACQGTVETCSDGVLNQNETGVDCGGVCAACSAVETCTDGIQNQNESGVDCGGVCAACNAPETCTDGLQNQNEEGVDCGGVCAACETGPECPTAGPSSSCEEGEVCVTDDNDENGMCDPACEAMTCLNNQTDSMVCMTDSDYEEYNTCVDLSDLTGACNEASSYRRDDFGPLVLWIETEDAGWPDCPTAYAHVAAVYAPNGLGDSAYLDHIKQWNNNRFAGVTYSQGTESGVHPDIEGIRASELDDVLELLPGVVDEDDFDVDDFYWAEFYTCGSVDVVFVVDEDDLQSNAYCLE